MKLFRIFSKKTTQVPVQKFTSQKDTIQQEKKALHTQESFKRYIQDVKSDHLATISREYPEKLLHPEVERMVKIVGTNPNMRTIDKGKLTKRIKRIFEMPPQYFENTSDICVARIWHFTELQICHERGITEFQVVGYMDEKTCPVCLRLYGKYFSVFECYEKMAKLLNESISTNEITNAFEFPKNEDIDNKSPEEIREIGLFPPFHRSCRCQIVSLGDGKGDGVSLIA